MKKLLLFLLMFLLFLCFTSMQAYATSYSGALTTEEGSLEGYNNWDEDGISFAWIVDNTTNSGFWTYDYTLNVVDRDISHFDLEVSTGLGFNQIIESYDTDGTSTTVESDQPKVNDGVYSIKWDLNDNTQIFDLTIVSPRSPMWGDIYAKDGDGDSTYLQNAGFGIDPDMTVNPASNGNLYTSGDTTGWALVPDTNGGGGQNGYVIPEPTTMLLLGTGLIGCGLLYRRRRS